MRAIAAVLALAAGLVLAGPVPKAEAAGQEAYASGNLGRVFVYPIKASHVMSVDLSNGCSASVKLKPLQFSANAKLTKADVVANTPCGIVSLHWDAVGQPLLPVTGPPGVYRRGVATGTIAGQPFSTLVENAYIGLFTKSTG